MKRSWGQDQKDEETSVEPAAPGEGAPEEGPAPIGGAHVSGTWARAPAPPDLRPCRTFDEVHARCKHYVWNYICARVYDHAAAKDIHQEVFATVARKIPKGADSVPPALMGMLRAIIDGHIENHVRAVRRRRVDGEPDADVTPSSWPDPEQQLLRAERDQAIRDVCAELSIYERTLLELAHYEGLTYLEIGEMVGRPAGTVGVDLQHARARFRKIWGRFKHVLKDFRRRP